MRTVSARVRLAIGLLTTSATAVTTACDREPELAMTASTLVGAADVIGFETVSGWTVKQGRVKSIASTDVRTQGAAALAVTAPSGFTRIDGAPLPSSNAELAKIDRGASLAIDLMLPVQQANPFWFGAAQMYITCPSRNVFNAYLGQVELTGMRPGVYQTLRFKVTDVVAGQLHGATYNDLTVGIVLNVPTNSTGVYRLDNLRVKAGLPARPGDVTQIQSGQSLSLIAWKSYDGTPDQIARAAFASGVVQIPRSFHLVNGRAGVGTATFEVDLGARASALCRYRADPGGLGYRLDSCSSGVQAGDLLAGDSVRLTVVNGDPTAGRTKVRAQIALNPLGDELAAGLPPIPTFFGDTAAEIETTLNAFVTEQRDWAITDNEALRLPTPALDLRTQVEQNGVTVPSNGSPFDPSFAQSGRVTTHDFLDAEWHVSGNADVNTSFIVPTGHIEAKASADVWLLGGHIRDVVTLSGTMDAVPTLTDIQTDMKFCSSWIGISQGCQDVTTLPFDLTILDVNPSISLARTNWYVFSVRTDLGINLKAKVSGKRSTGTGFSFHFEPSIAFFVELNGGLAVGSFAGGGLFGKVDLLGVKVPLDADVGIAVDLRPSVCQAQVSETLLGDVELFSLGGSVGYFLEGGLTCGLFSGLCWRDEETVFEWGGGSGVFHVVPTATPKPQSIDLDKTLCAFISGGSVNVAYPAAQQTFRRGDLSFLKTEIKGALFPDPGAVGGIKVVFPDCHKVTWTSSDPSDGIVSDGNCHTFVTYGDSGPAGLPSPRTISFNVTDPDFGTASGSVGVSVVGNDPALAARRGTAVS